MLDDAASVLPVADLLPLAALPEGLGAMAALRLQHGCLLLLLLLLLLCYWWPCMSSKVPCPRSQVRAPVKGPPRWFVVSSELAVNQDTGSPQCEIERRKGTRILAARVPTSGLGNFERTPGRYCTQALAIAR